MTKAKSAIRSQIAQREVWEQRTLLVKKELAAASAANDAKTVRLRALRLEKERLEAEAAPAKAEPAPAKPPRTRRILVR
jgi:hypothetical protein